VEYATVSRHLAVLRQAEIPVDLKPGKHVFYRLADAGVPGVADCLIKRYR